MKSRLIVNPVSGADAALTFLPVINSTLRENFGELDVSLTVGAGDAQQIAAATLQDGNYSHIFVAGGDGTLNEVLNGAATVENAFSQVTFGLIPLGTGNDFADALGLPEDVEATLEILKQKKTVQVDVGKLMTDADTHFFINVSAGGFIAEVSDAVNPELKSFAGKLAYLIGGAQVMFNYEPVKTTLKVYLANEIIQHQYDVEMFAVCNSRLVGGGRLIAPEAVINDGLLDVCIFKDVDTLQFINLLREIAIGTHLDNEETVYLRVPEIELEFDREIKINTDGEVLSARKCHYQVLPRAARFLAGDMPFAD